MSKKTGRLQCLKARETAELLLLLSEGREGRIKTGEMSEEEIDTTDSFKFLSGNY